MGVHPTKMQERLDGSYPEPNVFNIAGGAMWNNKLDNILVYHRPNYHVDKNDSTCTMTSLKIKRQKIVGKKGTAEFGYIRKSRRFDFTDAPINNFMVNKLDEVNKTFNLEFLEMQDPM